MVRADDRHFWLPENLPIGVGRDVNCVVEVRDDLLHGPGLGCRRFVRHEGCPDEPCCLVNREHGVEAIVSCQYHRSFDVDMQSTGFDGGCGHRAWMAGLLRIGLGATVARDVLRGSEVARCSADRVW